MNKNDFLNRLLLNKVKRKVFWLYRNIENWPKKKKIKNKGESEAIRCGVAE